MSHTPGPWKIGIVEEPQEVKKMSHGARLPILTPDSDEANYHPVCWVNGNGRMETGANARLIAAAPELLARCKEIEQLNERYDIAKDDPDLVHRVRAAILRAEDTTPR